MHPLHPPGYGPDMIVILTTVPTLKYLRGARNSARRVGGRAPSLQGTVTVVLTAIAYTVSTSPHAAYQVVTTLVKQDCSGSGWLDKIYPITVILSFRLQCVM